MANELDDFVRAVAENRDWRVQRRVFRELLLQVKRIAVRIKIQVSQRLLHRGQRQRRRAERIFVRRELDDVAGGQAEFARDFFDGAAGLINRQSLSAQG